MRYVTQSTTAAAWESSLKLFWDEGCNRVTSRGDPCTEAEDIIFEVANPMLEPRISAHYPLSLISFIDDFRSRLVDPQLGQTSNLNERLYRWPRRDNTRLDQNAAASALIRQFPDGRYSIINFWDPEEDLDSATPIGPLLAYPRVRSGRLNLTVIERSLDVITGAMPVLVGFASYQDHMARQLGVRVGVLRVLALSYQLLDIDVPIIPSSLVS